MHGEYAKSVGIKQVLNPAHLKGILLYCGPYNLAEIAEQSSSKWVKWIFHHIGWGYFKDKNWLHSQSARTANLIENVNTGFPPTYITDGNTASFEAQKKSKSYIKKDCINMVKNVTL